ncbi:MAG: hypothetical protein ACO36I_10260, partial [Candidatus Latescibacterota bacterium]
MKYKKTIRPFAQYAVFVIISIVSLTSPSLAQLARLQRLSGSAHVQINPETPYRAMAQTEQLPAQAHLKTGPTGLVRIVYDDGVEITVNADDPMATLGR